MHCAGCALLRRTSPRWQRRAFTTSLRREWRSGSRASSFFLPAFAAFPFSTRAAQKSGKKGKRAAPATGGGSGAASSTDYVMSCTDVRKSLPGGRVLFSDCNLSFLSGAKIGVLGANGSGKSSLLKVLAGIDGEFDGAVWRKPGLHVGYLPQEPSLDPSKDVMGNIRDGLARQEALLARFDAVGAAMGNLDFDADPAAFDALLAEQADLQHRIDDSDAWNLQHRVEIAMQRLHVPPPDAHIGPLSGGEKRRVALCRLLLEAPDVLLLDEPTNHLDADSVAWLEEFLAAFKGTVVSVTHDRFFLDNVARWILEIDRGLMLPFEGNYTTWLDAKRRRLDLEKRKEVAEARRLDDELKWIRNGRGKTNKAAVSSYEQRLKESQEGSRRAAQLESGAVVIPPGPRLGHTVLTVDGLSKRFGAKELFHDLSFSLSPGAIVGIVGANGAGKSTFFNCVAGTDAADSGTVRWGPTVSLGLVAQTRGGLDPDKTAYQEISQGSDVIVVGDRELNARTYVASFNFRGAAQEKRVGSMSGGERNRVHLAKVLREGHNVLLLDEPTNDLDVVTLRALEDALKDFAGCAMIVSHDRWFLERVCTHTLAFEGGGKATFFAGTLSQFQKARGGL